MLHFQYILNIIRSAISIGTQKYNENVQNCMILCDQYHQRRGLQVLKARMKSKSNVCLKAVVLFCHGRYLYAFLFFFKIYPTYTIFI